MNDLFMSLEMCANPEFNRSWFTFYYHFTDGDIVTSHRFYVDINEVAEIACTMQEIYELNGGGK